MSSTPSSPLPYGPLFRTLFFFVIGALFVSLAGRHKATREMMSVANVAGTIKNDETAKVRGGLHELVIDQPTRDPAVSHQTVPRSCVHYLPRVMTLIYLPLLFPLPIDRLSFPKIVFARLNSASVSC